MEQGAATGSEGFPADARRDGHKYFDLGRDWQRIKVEQGLTDDDMFAAYVLRFLDDVIAGSQVVRFASDPVGDPGFLGRQFEYLADHGYELRLPELAAYPTAPNDGVLA